MTIVHKALPYLGSPRSLTRLSVTCRSPLDVAFLSALRDWSPSLECLRLARPLKDDADTKAFALYKFAHWEEVVQRLVSCLGPPNGSEGLQKLNYFALDLSFCDFREMRLCHAMQGSGAQILDWVVLPNSLRMYGPRGRQELEDLNAPGLEGDEDGDESVEGGMLEEDAEMPPDEEGVGCRGRHMRMVTPHTLASNILCFHINPSNLYHTIIPSTHLSTQTQTPSRHRKPHPYNGSTSHQHLDFHLPPHSIQIRTQQPQNTFRASTVDARSEHKAIGSSSKSR